MFKFLALLFITTAVWANAYKLSTEIFETQSLEFISHRGNGSMDNYLTMEVPYAPVQPLFNQIQKDSPVPLINRGEAHITVVTPIEFSQELNGKISMKEIDQLAKDNHIQAARFEIVCLGSGQIIENNVSKKNYFIVVTSNDLIELRHRIKAAVEARGFSTSFDPKHFYSHITVGFTHRDLHEADGVIKDLSACVSDISLF